MSKQHLEQYRNEMRRLNEAQLELEALKIQARSLPEYCEISELQSQLEKMEDYVRQILRERECFEPDLAKGNKISFSEFKRLDEFTDSANAQGKSQDHQMKCDFAEPYDHVIELISKKLR